MLMWLLFTLLYAVLFAFIKLIYDWTLNRLFAVFGVEYSLSYSIIFFIGALVALIVVGLMKTAGKDGDEE